MIKILHAIPTLEGGGAERQLTMLALEQSRRGYEVHIALRRNDGTYAKMLEGSGVQIHLVGDLRGYNPIAFLNFNSLLLKLKPDLVQTWLQQMDIIGGILAIYNSIPLVCTERNSKSAYNNYIINWIRKLVFKRSCAVVSNSNAGASFWRDALTNKTLLKIIPNSVDVQGVQRALPPDVDLFKKNRKLIIVVGRKTYQKGVDTILRGIASLHDPSSIRVVLIGDGPLYRDYEELIKTLQIGDSVEQLTFQSDWWGWLKIADVLISMSRYEGNPNVVLESMAGLCPLIVSDIPEHREILTDHSASFVPVDSPIDLAAAIDKLLSDPDSARIKADIAKKYVDSLTIGLCADRFDEVYHHVFEMSLKCAE